MKNPQTFGTPTMFRGFRILLIFCGILLVVMVALLYMSRQSHAKATDQESVVATPGQPEVPAGFVQEATNAQDVTEAALNALGYTLSNTVTVSVK
jgi:hypothetical protein